MNIDYNQLKEEIILYKCVGNIFIITIERKQILKFKITLNVDHTVSQKNAMQDNTYIKTVLSFYGTLCLRVSTAVEAIPSQMAFPDFL